MTKQAMTVKQAREEGYTHYMFVGDTDSVCSLSTIEQDIGMLDVLYEERLVLCAKETWSIQLDPLSIIESATEDLHQEAKTHCLISESYKELVALCAKLNKEWEVDTRSYHPTEIFIIKENNI
jgi:hypothetical protein